MSDIQPAPHLLRHLDPDSHSLNAIQLTESVLDHDACRKDRSSFIHCLGGMLQMYELIQEMANAVTQFECRYEHSPWSDLIGIDWDSFCITYATRVVNHALEYEDWPDLHALLRDIALQPHAENGHA